MASDVPIDATFEEIRSSGNLPSPAGVGLRILELTRGDGYSTAEIAATLQSDPSLAGRILMLANSTQHASVEAIATVPEAIVRLGSRVVRDMALAFSLVSEKDTDCCSAFDFEGYWNRCLGRAVFAQTLAREFACAHPGEAYVAALLADVGRLALACVHPKTYGPMLQEAGNVSPDTLLGTERARYQIDHAQISGCMLRDWGLPSELCESAEAFGARRSLTGSVDDLADVLRVADALATGLTEEADAGDAAHADRGRVLDLLTELLDGSDVGGLLARCLEEWREWAATFELPMQHDVSVELFLERTARTRGASLGAGPEQDAKQTSPMAMSSTTAFMAHDAGTESERQVRILTIDGDAVVLERMREQLAENYEVEQALDGKAGLRLALKDAPDIVVVDRDAAKIDGLELCKALRRTDAGRRMYVILLSERYDEDMIVEAFDAGVDDVVAKPLIPRLLSARIKGGVRLANLQRKIGQDKQIMMRQVTELGMLTRKLRSAALTDPLTELPNRRYAMKRLESEWTAGDSTGRPLSLVMLDIDHFKLVNDEHGHDVGDSVLRAIAGTLRGGLRQADEVCRMGGEEFLVIAKNTSQRECALVAERVRKAVEADVIPELGRSVTISLGVAGRHTGLSDLTALLKAADEAVYAAKAGGRNQVCEAPPPPSQLRTA